MTIHLGKRELLAQPVAVTVVGVNVDRPFVQKRIVQTVQLLANRFLLPLDGGDSLLRLLLHRLPRVQHAILHESQETGRWLQASQFGHEQFFELRFGDVDRAARTAADLDGAEHSATISRVMAASAVWLVKASEIQSTRGRQETYAGGGAEATSDAF